NKDRIFVNKYTRWLLRLIGPAILAYFLLTTDLGKILDNLRDLRWGPFVLSLALYPVFVAVKAWRWNMLMRDLGMEAPPLGYSMALYMIGLFLGGATPGQSGDFIKAWYLRERGQPLASGLFSILLDRLFDFLIMAILSLLGLVAFLYIFPPALQAPIQITTIAFAVLMVLLIPALMARRPRDWLMNFALRLVPRRFRAAIDRWRSQFADLDMRPALLANLLVATIASATSTMLRLWLLFEALNLHIPILALVSSMALIAILQALPISFSGVGVRDAILVALLANYGYAADKAIALSALFLLVNIEHILIGFLVSLRYPLGRTPSDDLAQSDIPAGKKV
ncbi:MAG TPA: lysylphosphatidylglycerol synthase transmembrane domain-containing protein, partial [Roseiflexaceae bacterium]|nr:lysylphosphatidylglycerol synthase transmembrane domain-containing protein [Roseiflexaceae bacterium]